jgi:opacity protein-like surface antigen
MKLATIVLASVLAVSSSMALAAGAGGAGAVGAGDAGSGTTGMSNGTTNGNGRTQVNPPRSTIGPSGARTIPNPSGIGH